MTVHRIILRRQAERDAAIEKARAYALTMQDRVAVRAVIVFGSYARGDFNKWSDIDVLVIADGLPEGFRARTRLLHEAALPGIQVVGWTASEAVRRRARHDPIALEAETRGVTVLGSSPFR